jgi:hypothetical protein
MNAGVVGGKPKNSRVYNALNGGDNLMPPSGKLSGNQIALVYSWIQSGAENTTGCGPGNYHQDTIQPPSCDTTNLKYNPTMKTIFDACCNSLSCHGGSIDPNFSTYSGLANYLAEDKQKLLDNINYVSGSQYMPPTTKLDSCTLKKITIWIKNGYPEN